MADGIFDFLARDENRMALGLLAQGGDFGRALAGAVQYADQGKANKRKQAHEDLQNQLLQTQMANYQSEIRNRDLAAVRDARRQSWLTDDEPAGAPGGGGSAAGQPGMPSMAGAPGGMPPGAGGGGAPGGRGGLMGLARELGVDPRLIRTDMALTDGKGITEMLSKRAMPNWQNINGNLVNTNAPGFQGGLQGGMASSADGKVTMWQPDGRGGLVAGAVPGATDAYAAFENIKNRSSAGFSPGRPVIGADGRQYGQSQLAEIGGGGAPSAPAMAPPGMGGRAGPTNPAERGMAADVASVPYDLQREIAGVQRQIQTGLLNTQDRAQARQYLQELQAKAQGAGGAAAPAQSPATGALSFSPEEEAAQAAAKTRANNSAAADVVRDTGQKADAKRSNQFLPTIDRAIELLNQGPTSSLVGVGVDAALGAFGKSTKGAEIGEQLSALSGWLTSNVPRMEGPQSDRDAANYAVMAGRVGDNTKPISVRLAAAREVRNLQMKYAGLNGIEAPGSAGGGSQGVDTGRGAQGAAPQQATAAAATMRFNPQTGRLERIN